jgi:hypothetical protein
LGAAENAILNSNLFLWGKFMSKNPADDKEHLEVVQAQLSKLLSNPGAALTFVRDNLSNADYESFLFLQTLIDQKIGKENRRAWRRD